VYSGGSAERAGLAPGDTLVAFDGLKASSEGLATLLERRAPGERIRVHAFRRDDLRVFDVELDAVSLDTCYLTLIEDATPQMLRWRAEWLGEQALGVATRGPRD
jgi:predicted metalloprotease with PDZ domain